MKESTLTLYIKLGTWEQALEGDPKETITIELVTMSQGQMIGILMTVCNDERIDREEREEPMRKEEVCEAVIRWHGRRPKGVTPYSIPRQAVDNIPVWMQEIIAQRARELYNAAMKAQEEGC